MTAARVQSSDFSSHAAAAFFGSAEETPKPQSSPPHRLQQGQRKRSAANCPAGRPNSREITPQIITVLSVSAFWLAWTRNTRPLEGHRLTLRQGRLFFGTLLLAAEMGRRRVGDTRTAGLRLFGVVCALSCKGTECEL